MCSAPLADTYGRRLTISGSAFNCPPPRNPASYLVHQRAQTLAAPPIAEHAPSQVSPPARSITRRRWPLARPDPPSNLAARHRIVSRNPGARGRPATTPSASAAQHRRPDPAAGAAAPRFHRSEPLVSLPVPPPRAHVVALDRSQAAAAAISSRCLAGPPLNRQVVVRPHFFPCAEAPCRAQ